LTNHETTMKAMLHVHTCFSSDGELTPRTIGRLARERGFDAVLLADHYESLNEESFAALREECRWVTSCAMVPGYERSWNGYHVLALATDRLFADADPRAWAERVRGAGGLVVMAHPGRYQHRIPESILELCDAVEVWNSKPPYDGSVGPDPRAYGLLGERRVPLCGQDLHGVRHLSGVAIEIAGTPVPSADACGRAVVDAIRRGDYRMSNGKVRYQGRELSASAARALGTFHRARRVLVDVAIGARVGWRRAAARRLTAAEVRRP
jgi:hypothetical protein